jgi:putative Ca2+/H+ antiporter (TMEM165/GDT1 family)
VSTVRVMTSEPVTIGGLVQAAVAAAAAVAVGFFGWEPTESQIVAVQAVQAFVVMATAVIVRGQVTPSKDVALTNDAVTLIEAGRYEARGGTP